MEFFINELSFEGQLFDNISAQTAVACLVALTDVILYQIKEGVILKSDALLYSSIRAGEILTSTIEHFPRELKAIVIRRIYDSAQIMDWNTSRTQDMEADYFCQVTGRIVSNSSVAEAAERTLLDSRTRYLLNLSPSGYSVVSQAEITKMIQPKISCILSCLCSQDALKDLFSLKRLHFDDFLRENKDFIKTKFDVQGRAVYRKEATGEFWYLDNFHRNHFEVFSSTHKHIGEADLEGMMNENTRDSSKDNSLVF